MHYWVLHTPNNGGVFQVKDQGVFQVKDQGASHTVASMVAMHAVPIGPTLWKWKMWDGWTESGAQHGPREPTYGYEDVTLTITELAREGEVRQDNPSGY